MDTPAGAAGGNTRFDGALPTSTDVLVVGAGIAGTATAYHLARTGVDVTLVERREVGGGATAAAAGVLSAPVRQPYHETVRFMGADAARAIWDFALRSMDGMADLLEARGEADAADLDRSGGYVLSESWTDHVVWGSFQALSRAGLPVGWLSSDEVRELVGPSRGFTGGYRLEGGGALHPPAAARALGRAAAAAGAHVVEGVEVSSVQRHEGPFLVVTDQGEIRAQAVVYAAHVDSGAFLPEMGAHLTQVRGQAFQTSPLPRRFRGGFVTDWKMNVWRQAPDGRLVVSGWRHDAWERSYGQDAEVDPRLQNDLKAWFESTFPDLAPLEVEREWSGVFGWTADYLPLVGAVPGRPGEWMVGGFSGGGLPFAFEAGRALCHALAGGEAVAGAELLEPSRFLRDE